MDLLTANEITLYGIQLKELIEGPGQSLTLTLAPKILSDDALLNKSVQEIEKMALEEAEKRSPNYRRGKEVKRKGYARYRFLKGFKIMLEGREVIYKLEWISVELPVLYGIKGRVKTQVEETLLRKERKVFATLMLVYSVLGGKLNAKLWMPQIEVSGNFKYVIVDGKCVSILEKFLRL
ncbi:Partial transposase ISC1250 [Saccharolobus solfataricus P2]|uniref:Partial transposase ISC1250 n=2 Tax=Saccharolobus solfataricus TaxID=2287 RepID=Q97YB5_SACS2|nr:Partial transposase ISC1250 [Saccharolobus solfataricus P2]SAI85090.1 partial transposase in ISC1250 [Saccharolobus solfataricus]